MPQNLTQHSAVTQYIWGFFLSIDITLNIYCRCCHWQLTFAFAANSSIFDIFLLESILFLEKLETSEVFPFTERASGKAGNRNRE